MLLFFNDFCTFRENKAECRFLISSYKIAKKVLKTNTKNKVHLCFYDEHGRIPAARCARHNARVVCEARSRKERLNNSGKNIGRMIPNRKQIETTSATNFCARHGATALENPNDKYIARSRSRLRP